MAQEAWSSVTIDTMLRRLGGGAPAGGRGAVSAKTISRKASGTWKLRCPVGDQARNCASFSGSFGPPGRSMRKTLKRQRSPGFGRQRRPRGCLRRERRPGQDRDDRPAGRAPGGVLPRVDPALEPRRVPLLVESVLRPVHPEVHDRVHRVPLDLGVGAAGRAHVEEELDHLLVPQPLVPPRERVPGRGVRDVVAKREAVGRPQRTEARGDRLGPPRDALRRRPRRFPAATRSVLGRGRAAGDHVPGRLPVDRGHRECRRRLVLAGEERLHLRDHVRVLGRHVARLADVALQVVELEPERPRLAEPLAHALPVADPDGLLSPVARELAGTGTAAAPAPGPAASGRS